MGNIHFKSQNKGHEAARSSIQTNKGSNEKKSEVPAAPAQKLQNENAPASSDHPATPKLRDRVATTSPAERPGQKTAEAQARELQATGALKHLLEGSLVQTSSSSKDSKQHTRSPGQPIPPVASSSRAAQSSAIIPFDEARERVRTAMTTLLKSESDEHALTALVREIETVGSIGPLSPKELHEIARDLVGQLHAAQPKPFNPDKFRQALDPIVEQLFVRHDINLSAAQLGGLAAGLRFACVTGVADNVFLTHIERARQSVVIPEDNVLALACGFYAGGAQPSHAYQPVEANPDGPVKSKEAAALFSKGRRMALDPFGLGKVKGVGPLQRNRWIPLAFAIPGVWQHSTAAAHANAAAQLKDADERNYWLGEIRSIAAGDSKR